MISRLKHWAAQPPLLCRRGIGTIIWLSFLMKTYAHSNTNDMPSPQLSCNRLVWHLLYYVYSFMYPYPITSILPSPTLYANKHAMPLFSAALLVPPLPFPLAFGYSCWGSPLCFYVPGAPDTRSGEALMKRRYCLSSWPIRIARQDRMEKREVEEERDKNVCGREREGGGKKEQKTGDREKGKTTAGMGNTK